MLKLFDFPPPTFFTVQRELFFFGGGGGWRNRHETHIQNPFFYTDDVKRASLLGFSQNTHTSEDRTRNEQKILQILMSCNNLHGSRQLPLKIAFSALSVFSANEAVTSKLPLLSFLFELFFWTERVICTDNRGWSVFFCSERCVSDGLTSVRRDTMVHTKITV